MQTVFSNKKVYHDYAIVEKLEAGISLQGWEVKSIKQSMGDFRGAFIITDLDGSLVLKKANVPAWKTGEPKPETARHRDRRLLVSKKQAQKFAGLAARPGYTMLPLDIYVNDKGLIKLTIAIAKGKKQYEKKALVKEKDIVRQEQRERKGWV
jgi:SsrA-binding protein